jgi:superfamily II DNA helicase RecQ
VGATQSNSARDNIREVNRIEQTCVNTTRSNLARENNAYEENEAGASSSFDLM